MEERLPIRDDLIGYILGIEANEPCSRFYNVTVRLYGDSRELNRLMTHGTINFSRWLDYVEHRVELGSVTYDESPKTPDDIDNFITDYENQKGISLERHKLFDKLSSSPDELDKFLKKNEKMIKHFKEDNRAMQKKLSYFDVDKLRMYKVDVNDYNIISDIMRLVDAVDESQLEYHYKLRFKATLRRVKNIIDIIKTE